MPKSCQPPHILQSTIPPVPAVYVQVPHPRLSPIPINPMVFTTIHQFQAKHCFRNADPTSLFHPLQVSIPVQQDLRSHPRRYLIEGLADSSLYINGTKLPFFRFLQANSTTSGHGLPHSKASLPSRTYNSFFACWGT